MRKLSLWLTTSALTFSLGVGATLLFALALGPDYEAVLPREKTCEMHGAGMTMEKVPVTYGMRIGVNGYSRAREEFFPHVTPSVGGGCVRGKEQYVEAWVCPKCREARLNWIKEHSGLRPDEVAE